MSMAIFFFFFEDDQDHGESFSEEEMRIFHSPIPHSTHLCPQLLVRDVAAPLLVNEYNKNG